MTVEAMLVLGTYCTFAGKFERGWMFRHYCGRCIHNTAHLGDHELHCPYLEQRITSPPGRKGEIIPSSKPSIRIPLDLR